MQSLPPRPAWHNPYLALQLGLAALFGLLGLLVLFVLLVATRGVVPFLLATLASVLPVPIYATLILWVDRHEKEPGWLLLSAFFWGSTVAVLFALVFNNLAGSILEALFGPLWALRFTIGVVAPVVEETAKGLALVGMAAFLRDEFDNLTDGLVYGALVGLGFGVAENVLYLGRAFAAGGFAALTLLFLVRVIVLGLMHSIWTGCTGAALGYAREHGGAARFVAPPAGYLAAVFLHALWNSTNLGAEAMVGGRVLLLLPLLFGVILLPPLLLLGVLAFLAERRERELVRTHLLDLVSAGILTEDELRAAATTRIKSRRLWEAFTRKGPRGWLVLRQFYDTVAELAFIRWRRSRSRPAGSDEDFLRQRLADLRSRLEALAIPWT
ncbi:MAG: PrsW family intramembrane metalloprotease [Armatimonadota bacterium]|nr:PrsW family intramembrane metalloprotease [Armatimonadota bacterium]MDW8155386.1 PrsW family intramembrane metalloprotease [Armatimonadota bacterium]